MIRDFGYSLGYFLGFGGYFDDDYDDEYFDCYYSQYYYQDWGYFQHDYNLRNFLLICLGIDKLGILFKVIYQTKKL